MAGPRSHVGGGAGLQAESLELLTGIRWHEKTLHPKVTKAISHLQVVKEALLDPRDTITLGCLHKLGLGPALPHCTVKKAPFGCGLFSP